MKNELPIISSRDNVFEILSLGQGTVIAARVFDFYKNFPENYEIINRNGMVLGKIHLPDSFRIVSNTGLPDGINENSEIISLLTNNSPELLTFSKIDYNHNIHDFFTIINKETQDFIFILSSKGSNLNFKK